MLIQMYTHIIGVPKCDKELALDSLSATKDSSEKIHLFVNKNFV